MSKKKRMPLGGLTVALLSASVVLLAGSTVGSARAALTYYSENYGAQVEVSNIGVSLVENDKVISKRDYASNGKWDEEAIKVTNSGSIDSYVRVILKKSWTNKEGVKDTTLSPDLIDLNLKEGSGWVIDKNASTKERTILYYTGILPAGIPVSILWIPVPDAWFSPYVYW